LFVLLDLPSAELEQAAARLVDVLNRLNQGDNAKGADLMPQNLAQMGLLGLSAPTLAALQPYATLLPERSRLNINTASAQAISASVPGLALAQAQALVLARTSAPFKSTDQAHERVPALKSLVVADRVWGVYSEFFEVNARVALGNVLLQERTVLSREDARLQVIRRAYVLPAALGP
jgi:general secretion pathway protein K